MIGSNYFLDILDFQKAIWSSFGTESIQFQFNTEQLTAIVIEISWKRFNSALIFTISTWPNVRQFGRKFRRKVSADLAENFGRIFGFGRTLLQTHTITTLVRSFHF